MLSSNRKPASHLFGKAEGRMSGAWKVVSRAQRSLSELQRNPSVSTAKRPLCATKRTEREKLKLDAYPTGQTHIRHGTERFACELVSHFRCAIRIQHFAVFNFV